MTDSQTATQKSIVGDRSDRPDPSPPPVRAPRYWTGDHAVNIRLTIPFLVKSYYLTIVAGTERRSPERRAEERKNHPLLTVGNVTAIAGLALGIWLYTLIVSGAIAG